jgi:hypothetical protein
MGSRTCSLAASGIFEDGDGMEMVSASAASAHLFGSFPKTLLAATPFSLVASFHHILHP